MDKLGLSHDPDSWTEEQRTQFCRLDIDPTTITWKRANDVNDRML